jgi:hypothetical protein
LPLILLLPLLIALIVKKRVKMMREYGKSSLLFFVLAFCGILPVMLSFKQSGFYIIPAYPFLAIALALPFQPFMKSIMEKINLVARGFLIFKIISRILLLSVLLFSFSQKGKIARNEKELNIVFACSQYIPQHTVISIDKETSGYWLLHACFARYNRISLDANNNIHSYYLHDKNLSPNLLDENYIYLTEIENFVLFKRNNVE